MKLIILSPNKKRKKHLIKRQFLIFQKLKLINEKGTNLSFNEIKEINIQLKYHQQICEKFKEYNRLIDNAKEIEHVLVKQNINDEEFLVLAKNDSESIKKTIPRSSYN